MDVLEKTWKLLTLTSAFFTVLFVCAFLKIAIGFKCKSYSALQKKKSDFILIFDFFYLNKEKFLYFIFVVYPIK